MDFNSVKMEHISETLLGAEKFHSPMAVKV